MNRRHLLGSLSGAVLATAAASAAAQHEHHMHEAAASGPVKAYDALIAATESCVAKAQICHAHCIRLLSDGDTDMGECARTTSQVMTLCNALLSLAAQGSPLTPALAKVALEGCKQCAQACKPHAPHHAECKACYESCMACIRECEALS